MSTVIVPTLPDFTRHRLGGQKQYQSKHHHDRHFGPFFEDPLNTSGTLQLEFHEGTESILNCRVGMLKDKTVCIYQSQHPPPPQCVFYIYFYYMHLGYVGTTDD